MSAQPRLKPPIEASAVAARRSSDVAQGGVVADMQRMIEERYAAASMSLPENSGQAAMHLGSRLLGYAALLAGYFVAYQIWIG